MPDLSHFFGSDLAQSATGGLLLVDQPTLGLQRVLRRLLTNAGDLLFHRDYGAGLGRFVGQPVNPTRIAAVVTKQMLLESAVAPTPAPTVNVSWLADGSVFLDITYTDAPTQVPQLLTFSVAASGVVTIIQPTG